MEEHVPAIPSDGTKPPESYDLLILHTAEAQEWASYLQQILKSSRTFHHRSILLYAVGPADQLHGYNFDCFQSSKCIVLLLAGVFLDMLCEPELQEALHRLLYPPYRVVALLCGVTEDAILTESFEDWPYWRKLYSEDEPAVYISTILECVNESTREEAKRQEYEKLQCLTAASPTHEVVCEEHQENVQKENVQRDEEPVNEVNSKTDTDSSAHPSCLSVQPSRVRCGEQQTIYIMLKDRVDVESVPEVEFSSEHAAAKRIRATVENEYTLSVCAPDMPAGAVSVTLHTEQSSMNLRPLTFFTDLGEVSRHLENAADPVNFICQAFNLTSNSRESLDIMLTDSLKSKMPATGMQLFGIRQIEENNMASCKRNEELPTLLHFAAKYGLKKLTSTLLQCPGALQAYSVMNRNGDYPNTLAEKNGFSDLRQFIDEYVETADMLKSHIEETINTEENADVYEMMTANSEDIMMKYSGCSEDIYESMLGIDPECAEDLYEVMNAVDENPEEAMLRKFFQAKPLPPPITEDKEPPDNEEEEKCEYPPEFGQIEEEEDPYALSSEDIYDIVDTSLCNPGILNRPPAPVPRPEPEAAPEPEPEKHMTYISRVFSDKGTPESTSMENTFPAARPVSETPSSVYDPYAGMKTPGQRQLISLQERVKVGEITVDEAVQEFKAWQFDHERRANSLRYQQENLKRLRDSITRRHKQREKDGQTDYEISAPLQRNLYWGAPVTLECSVYEPTPRVVAPPPSAVQVIQRSTWKTGSTSSTSSTESNRLSTHSTFSLSSGTEPDEDTIENLPPPPPRPPRTSDAPPLIPPPRIPPRIPERAPEKVLHERYISCPTRALPQRPPSRFTSTAPPIPSRPR
ncbi:phosphoinositide 3-kinase adapter protein 1 isoform X2 [Sphaeramia orbicularis]|uniref:DBB domain-containing protein n=1 Tax=Sphaeramia orbicularis TaxID=375764 RepID=A0A673B6A1_9TELE|nr:phosphoinositide 3-kinase adapter protein 1 isoform X2 [Sphaeramia orbicularis]